MSVTPVTGASAPVGGPSPADGASPSADGPSPPAIAVHDLVKSFGEVRAVRGVEFEVAAGEVFGFLGPNGAGKTTTINMLCTLVKPTSGRGPGRGA